MLDPVTRGAVELAKMFTALRTSHPEVQPMILIGGVVDAEATHLYVVGASGTSEPAIRRMMAEANAAVQDRPATVTTQEIEVRVAPVRIVPLSGLDPSPN